jgi:hypothetical protein
MSPGKKEETMRKIVAGALVLIMLTVHACATLFFPNLLFFHPLQGRMNLKIFFLAPTGEDGFLLAGNDNYSEYIIKTDQQGRKLWDYVPKTLDYPSYTSTALVAHDGKYLLSGTCKVRLDSTKYDWYEIVRVTALNIAGTLEWEQTYLDSICNIPACMGEARDGGFLIAGKALSSQGFFSRCLFISIDSSGAMRSRKYYGAANDNQQIYGLEKTADDNFLVLAHRDGPNMAWLLKVSQAGDTLWTRLLPYLAGNRLNSIRRTSDGNFICAGFTTDYTGKSDFWVVKIDPAGNPLWHKTYQMRGADTVKSIDTIAGGGIYRFDGNAFVPLPDALDGLTIKSVDDIAVDRSSSVWFLPYYGIGVQSTSSVIHYTSQNLPFPEFMASRIKIDAGGAVWTSTSIGLLRFANGQWSRFDSTNTALPSSGITAFAVDASGTPYAACGQGFSNLSKKTNILYDYYNSPLPSNIIRCIEFDKGGNMWIGTDQGLVCIHSPSSRATAPFSHNRAFGEHANQCRSFLKLRASLNGYDRSRRYYDIMGRMVGDRGEMPLGTEGASRVLIEKRKNGG